MKKAIPLFLLSWLYLMFSCKEDDIVTDSQIQNMKEISFQQLQQKLSSQLSQRFSVPGVSARGIEDFEIDTTEVVMISTKSSTTYSMKVKPVGEESESTYNYYLYDKNGEIYREIVKFDVKEGEAISGDNTEVVYTNKAGCITYAIAPCEYGNWHDESQCEGDGWETITICGGGGSDGGGGNDTGGNDPVTTIGLEPVDGTGGGGGGTENHNPVMTPCQIGKKLKTNAPFRNKMQNLKNSAQDDRFEKGFLMKPNNTGANGGYDYTEVRGEEEGDGIDLALQPGDEYAGFIHSHYDRNDMLSVFSVSDLVSLWTMFDGINMVQPEKNFVMGVVTAKGTTYLLLIEDLGKFIAFGQSSLSTQTGIDNLQHIYQNHPYTISSNSSNNNNEQSIAKILKHMNTGLKLMKGNYLNFYGWDTVDVDNNGNVTPNYCP